VTSAEPRETGDDETSAEGGLGTWRDDIRRHALRQLALRPAKPPKALRIGVLAVLLLLHAVWLIGLRHAMHVPTASDDTAVEIRLITGSPEPLLPEPQARAARVAEPSPRRISITPRPTAVATTTVTPGEAAEMPQLFDADGAVRLPADVKPHAPTQMQIAAELMQRGHNVLHCRKTRYASGYKRDESLGNEVARKYLSWVGLYNAAFAEAKAAQRKADAAAACDG
jgi:hypothetical protein